MMTMKRFLYLSLLLAACVVFSGAAPSGGKYVVMFYNLENLFDTIKSPGVFDEEFTPSGAKQWNGQKYWKKIDNICDVFYKVSAENRTFPSIIGVSEIENRNVLEDIVAHKKLARANYQIVHYDSPDLRGVDVALLYRPDQFKLAGSKALPVTLPDQPDWKTRDVLMAWGTIEGEMFCFFVNHWPSRLGGQQASEYKRVAAATVVRNAADSMSRAIPGIKIAIMGDLNDDPDNKSIAVTLGAKRKMEDVAPGGYYNPFYDMFKKGYGTLAWDDGWNLFDNIIVSQSLIGGDGLKLVKSGNSKYYGYTFDRQFLKQQSGQYKNYPWRTFIGNTFQGGYSDHFPVFIMIGR